MPDKQHTGTFPWNEGLEIDDPWTEELYYFYEWLDQYGIADHIAKKLHYQKYLTEGEIAKILRIESPLKNPYRFFCGSLKDYYSALSKEYEERKQNCFYDENSLESYTNIDAKTVRLMKEALDEYPILPEEKDECTQIN